MPGSGTDLESLIARLGAEVLGLDRLDVEEDFFALGGDSIGALQWLNRIADATGVELVVRAVFETRTPQRLAEVVRTTPQRTPLREASSDGEAPLSPMQRTMWAHQVFTPESRVNNTLFALRLDGDLDVNTLARCLTEIVRRHEVLRTVFPYRSGGPVAVVRPLVAIELEAGEVSDLACAGRQLAARAFDLEAGPLHRWQLVRSGPAEHVLLISVHHMVFDRWSLGVLVNELAALYPAFRLGRPSPLPPLPLQFADHIRRLRARDGDPPLAEQVEHWRGVLADNVPPCELAPESDERDAAPWIGHRCTERLSGDERARLRQIALDENATLYMAIAAAFTALLRLETGRDTVSFAGLIGCRRQLDAEQLIGPLLNTVALQIPVRRAATWRELLRRTRDVVVDALTNQDVAWEALVRELHPTPLPGGNPHFRIALQMLNLPAPAKGAPGLQIRRIPLHGGIARFELLAEVEPVGDGLLLHFEAPRALLSNAALRRLAEGMRSILATVMADPDVPLDELAARAG